MIMEPYEVYRSYLALRLHFTTDNYDVIKQQGRVKATRNAFLKRKDLLSIRRVSETYSDKDIVNFLVANFVSGDRWGGIFDTEAKERYTNWKKRIESMAYTFEKEVSKLQLHCDKNGIEFKELFQSLKNQHPYIIKMFLRNEVSIETLVILDQFTGFTEVLDQVLSNDIIWPDVSRLIKKYTPFLTFNKEKYGQLFRRATGSD